MEAKKSPGADLETKRPYFTNIGLIISLSLMLVIFGWKTYDMNEIIIPERPDDFPPDYIDLPPRVPDLPKPPAIVQPTMLNVVKNTDPTPEDVNISAESFPDLVIPPYEPPAGLRTEEKQEIEPPILVPDVMPEFPGGIKEMYEFLKKNIEYTQVAKETGITGTVYLSFVVEKDGSVTDIRVQRGIPGGLTEEAIRVVRMMPKWTPGWKNGVLVRTQFSMPVTFNLK